MKKLLPLFLLLSFTAIAQRTIPYPIILIHGFNGNGGSYWANLHSYFRRAGLSVELNSLSYHLNQDGNTGTSKKELDVYQYLYVIGNHDVYTINFDNGNYSNQSGAVKQGYALKFAIQRVLDASGAKKVVLLGHSMGGLAAREYLQNSDNWQPDEQHHVAKLVTLGTPHFGSNLGTGGLNLGLLLKGLDERSEAVRDLRRSYSNNRDGVYLFGGYESNEYIQSGVAGVAFQNLDVNSNGQPSDLIVGLNQKTIPTNLAYACITGYSVPGLIGDSDGVVLTASQTFSLANFTVDQFRHECPPNIDPFNTCHTREPTEAIFPIIQALDEPSSSALAYEINVTKTEGHLGFFTLQVNNNLIDTDRYKFTVAQSGLLSIAASIPKQSNIPVGIPQESNGSLTIVDASENVIALLHGPSVSTTVKLPRGGVYYIDFTGFSGTTLEDLRKYGYATSFCPLPDPPTVVASSATTFCEGEQVNLSTPANLNGYYWQKDGETISNTSSIAVAQTGTYALQTTACGVTVSSANSVSVRVNPTPSTPIITIQNQPFGLLATNAINYQWYRNGQLINNAIQPLFSAVSTGAYTVKTTVSGCSSESLPFVITGLEEDVDELVNVQPNPSEGHFSVELPTQTAANIELIDMMGRQVYMQSDKVKSIAKTIDARPITAGVYILKVKYDEKELLRKIIVK